MSNVYDTYFVHCDGATLTCGIASTPHKHCNLCDKKFTTKYKCERHSITQAHASRVVVVEGQFCFPCRLEHNAKGVNRAHYHCLHWDNTIFIRNRFIKHVESHAKQKQAISKETTTTLPNAPNVPNVVPNPASVNHSPADLEQSAPELEHPHPDVEFLQRDLDCPPRSSESGEEQPPPNSEQLLPYSEQAPPNSKQQPQSFEHPPPSLESDDEVSAKKRKRRKKACQVCGKEMVHVACKGILKLFTGPT